MNRQGHALIVGGGIAGLLAAHVASASFDRVTILDRDRFPATPAPRPCAPQGRHLHMLMARGLQAIETLVPDFGKQLAAAGAVRLDFARDAEIWMPGGCLPRFESGIEFYACSRDLLEWVLRRIVLANAGIKTLQGDLVTGLIYNAEKRTVEGVLSRKGSLRADLIIDASGRASRAPEWLRSMGLPRVPETVIEAPLDYASRWYEPPANFEHDWQLLTVSPRYPEIRRSGTICAAEGGRWNVLLLSLDGSEVPSEESGFLQFAQGLAVPVLKEALRHAQPVSEIHRYRNNQNRRRHFEQVERWPHNFIVLGDAACALNPYAGLGMTSAALGVLILQSELRIRGENNSSDHWAKGFQARLSQSHREAWAVATNQHLRWPASPLPGNPPRLPAHVFVAKVMELALHDPAVAHKVIAVMHLLEPASSLFAPEMQARVQKSTA